MGTLIKHKRHLVSRLFLSVVLCLHLTASANADETPALDPETPAVDTEPIASPHTTLTGSIEKSDRSVSPARNSLLNGQTSDSSVNLQDQRASTDNSTAYALAVKKLASKAKLTSEDYRNLGVGIVGLDSRQNYLKKYSRVIAVYPGCPAEKAGIKVGDMILEKHALTSKFTHTHYEFTCGIAGEPVDYTIKRDGQILNFHIIQMNIEDIPDPKTRHMCEEFVRQTGWPADHVPVHPPVSAGSILRGLLGF